MKFYKDVFDWSFQQWGEQKYWMIMTAEKDSKDPGLRHDEVASATQAGINGGLLPRPASAPTGGCGANAFVCTVQVEHFDEMAKKIEASGGTIAMPKFAIPGMAWQGYFLDTEGNTFGVHQTDTNAK